jgi:hypothetical protein
MWIVVLLIFLVGAGFIGYIYYDKPRTSNTLVVEKQGKSPFDFRVLVSESVRANRYLLFYDVRYDYIQIHSISKIKKGNCI